jgi:ComF family protein
VAGWLSEGGRRVLDLLLPPQCLACDGPVDAPGRFCARCFRGITFLSDPCCGRCGHGFAHVGQAAAIDPGFGPLCSGCAARPPPWGRARGALLYDEASRGLILGLKYADRVEHAGPLASMMAREGAALLRDAELLVPVPLHRWRLLGRRYNQAALLARALSALAARRLAVDALRRTRRTVTLGHLDATAREAALRAAFAPHPRWRGAVRGRRVLLIDDVMTSGATAAACAEALLGAGAVAVDVLVAARVGHVGVG